MARTSNASNGVQTYVRGILGPIAEKFAPTRSTSTRRPGQTPGATDGLGEHLALVFSVISATWVRREVFPHIDDHPVLVRARAVARRGWSRMRLVLCRARGHHMVLRFERDRLFLHCEDCGADSPGWQIDVDPRFRTRRKNESRAATR